MAKINSCYLCGQNLNRGVCTCCGLDNKRMTKRDYRLNETTPLHVKKQQVAARNAENVKYAQAYKKEQQKPEDLSKSAAISKNKNNSKWKGLKIIAVAYGIIAVIPAISNCVGEMFGDYTVSTPEYEDVMIPETEDNYNYVQRDLSETGDYYEKEFGPGNYQIGVHIPEGLYKVSLSQGTYGNLYVEDHVNSIYLSPVFTEDTSEDYYYKELDDVRLYAGARIEISGDVRLNFISKNAQTSAMTGMENPMDLTAVATLVDSEEPYVVGKDIPAGVYDIRAIDGWTSVWISFEDEPGNSYQYYYWVDSDTLEDSYNNVTMVEGMVLTVENSDITLTPSEWIVTDDYETYFNEIYF